MLIIFLKMASMLASVLTPKKLWGRYETSLEGDEEYLYLK